MDPPDGVITTDDLTLLRAVRAGDRVAFGVLYLRHHAAAWRVACVASRFSPDAELAVIEGFTRVFSALPEESEEFQSGGVTFRPYVLACVRQAALDRARAAGRAEGGGEPSRRRGPRLTGRGEAARTAGRRISRPEGPPASPPPPALLAGLAPDGELVLSSLEHHVARGALAAVPERSRTALWLSDVEAMTPGEVAGILGGRPQEMVGLAAGARAEIHAAQHAALGRQEVRAGCRFTVDHLDAYQAGTLDPTEGLIVRSHLDRCPPCRMRQGELANAPAALAGAVPAAPLLGGEAQHHWLTSAADLQPAERLLPPGLAAGGVASQPALARRTAARLGTVAGAAMAPARRLPDALRRAGRTAAGSRRPQPGSIDLTGPSTPTNSSGRTGSPGWTGAPGWSGSPTPSLPPAWTIPPGRATAPDRTDRRAGRLPVWAARLPGLGRQAGRTVWPALPAMCLVVAWLVMMMAIPRLMTPGTAPGPDGVALPVVQAYVPGFSPGAGHAGRAAGSGSDVAVDPSARDGGSARFDGTELAAPMDGGSGRATAASAGHTAEDQPTIGLIATAASRPSGPARHDTSPVQGGGKHPVVTTGGAGGLPAAAVPVAVAVATPSAPTLTMTPVSVMTSTSSTPGTTVKPESTDTPGSSAKPTKPATPGKPREHDKAHKPAKPEGPMTSGKPEKPGGSIRKQSVPRARIVTA